MVDEDDNVDPFAVEERGLPIEVGDEEARVSRALQKTLDREGGLFTQGVTCAIKDRADTTCWACPVYRPPTSGDPISALCRIGREQDRLLTRMASLKIEAAERVEREAMVPEEAQC